MSTQISPRRERRNHRRDDAVHALRHLKSLVNQISARDNNPSKGIFEAAIIALESELILSEAEHAK